MRLPLPFFFPISEPNESMPPAILAVTFDMDGLIFNTEDLYDFVGSELLRRRGHVFSRELKLKAMGLPGPKSFEVLQRELGLKDTYEIFQAETDEIFAVILADQLRTMPGLETLLQLLERLDIPKAIATSAHREFAETALGLFELLPRFDFLLTRDDVSKGKPDPEIYLTAAAQHGISPDRMLVLEDSVVGSTAASASGAYTIAVPTVHSREQDFNHVHAVASSLADPVILNLLSSG